MDGNEQNNKAEIKHEHNGGENTSEYNIEPIKLTLFQKISLKRTLKTMRDIAEKRKEKRKEKEEKRTKEKIEKRKEKEKEIMIKCLKESMILFEIEDKEDRPVTEQTIGTYKFEEIEKMFIKTIEEMERAIKWSK